MTDRNKFIKPLVTTELPPDDPRNRQMRILFTAYRKIEADILYWAASGMIVPNDAIQWRIDNARKYREAVAELYALKKESPRE